MQTSRETQAIIDSLSDPILIMESRRGRVLACNAAFIHELGFSEENFKGKPFIRLPQFTRAVRHGMLDLYFRAKRRDGKHPFTFQYADPKGSLKTISATADLLDYEGQSCVLAHLHVLRSSETGLLQQLEEIAAFNALVQMTREPWMEFRSRSPVAPMPCDSEDRTGYLTNLGRELVVHRASGAAQELLGGKNSETGGAGPSLIGKDFISLFCRNEDALSFLDMLSNVGQLRAPTLLTDGSGGSVEVEMTCSVRFGTGDAIAALYCTPRRQGQNRNAKSLDVVSRQEHDFIFAQPFLGIGRLVPLQPLARPDAENADKMLDGYLDNVLLISANNALADIHGVPKNSLLMQPLARLFPERSAGVQVLKELFVTRKSSFADYDEETGELRRLTLFKAVFNNADHMVRIFLASSLQPQGFQEEHGNHPRSAPSFI